MEVKKEKIDEEAEKVSAECSENGAIGSPSPNDAKDFRSERKQSKPKRGPFSSRNAKKSVVTIRNKPAPSNKKKSIVSKKCKQHKCSTCDYTASRKYNLNIHMRTHTGEKPFPCTHCAKRFTHKSNLQIHMRSHVSEFLFSCSNCSKGFSQNDEKVEHEISCQVRRFECHLCKEYSTFQKTNLKFHMLVHHTGEKPFGCNRCSKRFTEQISLKSHLKTHINSRLLKFKCSVCYRNFFQRNEKDGHEVKCKCRGYECYLCKEFTSNALCNLKYHISTHTGLKPFQCEICQKPFSRKAILQKHMESVHK